MNNKLLRNKILNSSKKKNYQYTKMWTVAIIFSNWTLSKIYEFLYEHLDGNPDDIGISKIERYRDKKTREMRDSNRTIMLMKKSFFDKIIQAGLNKKSEIDFRIDEYKLSEKMFPAPYYNSDFYMIIPKECSHIEAETTILNKMKIFMNFGLLKMSDFSIKIPLKSRLSGEHRGFVYLSFGPDVDLNTKVYMKNLFNDSFMHITSIDKLYHLPVIWGKNNK